MEQPKIIDTLETYHDPGVDHWTAVKIILSYLRGLSKYFSVMEVIKEFVVKGYVDASFDTDSDDSNSQSGYILKWQRLGRVALCIAL